METLKQLTALCSFFPGLFTSGIQLKIGLTTWSALFLRGNSEIKEHYLVPHEENTVSCL